MENFKYSLDKGSKKHICPNCNKKTFVFYINTETGEYLPTDFGRCDREQNCNYHKAPPKGKKAYLINFLALTSISDKAYKLVDLNGIISIVPKSQILEQQKKKCFISEWYLKTSTINYFNCESKYFNTDEVTIINEVRSAPKPKVKPSFHGLELLDKMYFENPINNNLTEFLKTKFTSDEVFNAMQNYFLTGTNYFWNNATVFWQINHKEQIQGAKIMLYNKQNGKRIKEPYNHINWLHKAINEPDFNLCQCLFGLHLINEDYQKTIAIVESEKTAIVMSIFLPDFIWLATGSNGNFKFETLEPLKKRNVIAYPDKGEYINWLNKATELNSFNFKILVSDLIENTDFENGFDLADYYFKMHEM
ncbi:DUF6371 domain-containing protein [Flavobacterium sp. CBA20B-1]|uniref:DUF6371 domain-containing protein n=1 Tax=unclassified Flavobacterium TaxID=196869 RepID=UPI0022245E5C|nr:MULTISPECIES: DUF6371 domain-containing protein [unclassified Flavobacterium]WCM42700.1 DUF6371 domain-containing protein [Flavobacterium sp. CBA20B-1]